MGRRSNQRRSLTGFGRLVREYGEAVGIYNASELARALTAAGYNADGEPPGVTPNTVNRWKKGQQAVPPDVLPFMERLFELDEEGHNRIGQAFAWEQEHQNPFSEALVAA